MSAKCEFRYLNSTTKRYSGALLSLAPDCDFLMRIIGDRNSEDPLRKIHIWHSFSISASGNIISDSWVSYGLM